MSQRFQSIPIVSFYSYKGGSGRSVCAANVAGYLAEIIGASGDSPLLLLDMDVDSAGLTNVLSHTDKFEAKNLSVLDLLTAELRLTSKREVERFRDALEDVSDRVIGHQPPDGSVLLLGNVLGGRSQSLELSMIGRVKRELCESFNFSGILLDSAAGRQPAALMCHMISDVMVYCCRLSQQHLIGTRFQLKRHRSQIKKQTGEFPKVVIVPVAVPADSRNEELKKMKAQALQELVLLAKSSAADCVKEGIPEVESLKWSESVLRSKGARELMDDEKAALTSYRLVATKVGEALGPAQDKMQPE